MSVVYTELDGSPAETYGEDEFTATMTLKCAWADRHDLVDDYLGAGGALYPHRPGMKARAISASVVPFPGQQGYVSGVGSSYEAAQVTISFSNAAGDATDLVSESFNPSGEFRTLKYDDFTWSGGTPLEKEEAPGKLLVSAAYEITFHSLDVIPAGFLLCVGHVNHAPWASYTLGLTFPAETLMFQPAGASRKITTDEAERWTVSYSFLWQPNGWNHYWRQATSEYDFLKKKGQSAPYKSYQTIDFALLRP